MHVLMFCPQFRPCVGGAERQAEKLSAALVDADCHVTVLTPRIDPDSPDIEQANGVTIKRFPLTDLACRFPVPGVALLNIPYILWQVARSVRPHLKGADVLHCHIACLQTAGAALVARLAGMPVLCKAATADHRSDLGDIENTGISGRLVAWLVRTLIGTWVATTADVRQGLLQAGVIRRKIVHIPNGVDLKSDLGIRRPKGRIRRFLYLGRLSANANRDVPTLLSAFDRLAATYPDVELALVGGGDQFEETQRRVAACAVQERIHLLDFDQPDKWLAWADCFVLPSRREGLSNALLEAMAAGLLCIANDIPPNREVLDEGTAGVLVPVAACDALLEAMREAVENETMARRFAVNARDRAKQCYSIGAVAEQYLSLYRNLCHGHVAE